MADTAINVAVNRVNIIFTAVNITGNSVNIIDYCQYNRKFC